MTNLSVLLVVVVLLSARPLASEINTKIDVLTDANFEATLAFPPALWLVKFYAPWCKHCKKLDPVFSDLAEKAGGRVMLGSVDATKNPKTSDLYNIKSYPTILYKKDQVYGVYDGPRSLDGFLTFIDKASGPSVTEIKDIDSTEFLELQGHHDNVTFVLTLSQQALSHVTSAAQRDKVEQQRAAFREVARKLQFHASFAEVVLSGAAQTQEAAAEAAAAEERALVIAKVEKNRPPVAMVETSSTSYNASSLEQEIRDFVMRHNHPLVSVFDNHNFKRLAQLNRTVLIAVADFASEKTAAQLAASLGRLVGALDEAQQQRLVAGLLDAPRWERFLRPYGAHAPCFLLVDFVSPEESFFSLHELEPGLLRDDAALDEHILSAVLRPLLDGSVKMAHSSTRGMLHDVLWKFKSLGMWGYLVLVVPALCVVAALCTQFPEELKLKND